ncbi:MAG: hypothetical protein KME26_09295 [Oscillatoria princeps RMCB-10]|nr:hypothetical protein [Oscillatoria princeps RMCB-10]
MEESGTTDIRIQYEPIMKELGISSRTLDKAVAKLHKVRLFKCETIDLIEVRLPPEPAANAPAQPAHRLQRGPQSGAVPSQQSGLAPDDRDELPI